MALTKAEIQHAGTAAKKAVEAALSSKRKAPKRSAVKNAAGTSAFDARQKMGPYDGRTLERVIQAGLRTGVLTAAAAQRYRDYAKDKGTDVAKLKASLKRDLELNGVRFA